MSNIGVLPIQELRELLSSYLRDVPESCLNPASVDLPLQDEIYRLECSTFPSSGVSVRELLPLLGARPHDFSSPLEVGVQYLIRLGRFALPRGTYAYANPKSSTGRVHLLTRLIADGVSMYDALTTGWEGEAWALVSPCSFPIILSPGLSVLQLRLFNGKSFLSEREEEEAIQRHGLLFSPEGERLTLTQHRERRHGSAYFLSYGVYGVVGWKAKRTRRPLNFGYTKRYEPEEFFSAVHARPDGSIVLEEGGFYILSTQERVQVPPAYSAELRAVDVRLVDARVHAAGYIDPGWGYGEKGEACGRPITLEVIPYENGVLWVPGRPVARLRYERMLAPPDVLYDAASSNYIGQGGAQLSKHFV